MQISTDHGHPSLELSLCQKKYAKCDLFWPNRRHVVKSRLHITGIWNRERFSSIIYTAINECSQL